MSNTMIQDPIAVRYRSLLKIAECSALNDDLPSMFRSLAACLTGAVRFDALCVILQQPDKVQLLIRKPDADIDMLETTAAGLPALIDGKNQRPVLINGHSEWLHLLQTGDLKSGIFLPLLASRQNVGAIILGSFDAGQYHETDGEFLELLARQVAVALDKFQAYQKSVDLQQQVILERDRLQLLNDVN